MRMGVVSPSRVDLDPARRAAPWPRDAPPPWPAVRGPVPLRPGAPPPRQYPCHYAGPEGGSRCLPRVARPADLVSGAKDAHVTAPPPGPTRSGLGVFWVLGTPVATPTGGGGGERWFGEGWLGLGLILLRRKSYNNRPFWAVTQPL